MAQVIFSPFSVWLLGKYPANHIAIISKIAGRQFMWTTLCYINAATIVYHNISWQLLVTQLSVKLNNLSILKLQKL